MLYHQRRTAALDSELAGSKSAARSFVAGISLPILSGHFSRDAAGGGAVGIRPPTPGRLLTDCHFSDVLSKPTVAPRQWPGRTPEADQTIWRVSQILPQWRKRQADQKLQACIARHIR